MSRRNNFVKRRIGLYMQTCYHEHTILLQTEEEA